MYFSLFPLGEGLRRKDMGIHMNKKHLSKRIITFALSSLLLFQLPACGNAADRNGKPDASPSATPSVTREDDTGNGAFSDRADGTTAAPSPAPENSSTQVSYPVILTDSLGNQVAIASISRVVSLYGSFTEAYLLAGGSIVGTTQDAVEERGLEFSEEVTMLGTVKEPNLELIISLNPDLVILSADIANQKELGAALAAMSIPYAYFQVDTFSDYCTMMDEFVKLTGRHDLYQTYVTRVAERIDLILSQIPAEKAPDVLLIRAFSTGAKAKTTDNFTGRMLEEFHTFNIASAHTSLLEDLSLETIIAEDPDYIFITTMGNEAAALQTFAEQVESTPAWSELTAVKKEHCIVLPKDLFHYKPNARWDEAYEYLARILYPEIFN